MSTSDAGMAPGRGASRADAESSKRRDIIDGARRAFFDKGFDGASMDEVAKTAGVSKATIYAYFSGKAELFEALVQNDRMRSAESLFTVDASITDVDALLRRIGTSFMTMMVQPDHIRLLRMVMGAAEKFPRIGRTFYDAGPCHGGQRLAQLLHEQAELGRLQLDDELAAAHVFFNICQGNMVKALLFSDAPTPTPAQIEENVNRAVRVFLAAYGTGRPN
ncbi:TetR/AcrR family transcriptional regulator [Ancylobacter amanitiformis]|uniref:AcrR family transcriptional regulator n=1 Tax=Ancylobacter amanitiformis TaxID=217069 RepID=A0ABU0LLA1_9HYPH|nr:TetR/AcrR family transcriptional regulator [Ancylobacter amanitiformis]MDQ0509481.1 AcrR family transcriptional regulator [Ancylobacter amanitiformis]